jgi:glycosyltransferase involved in cell wall biosynthesis
VKILIVSDFYPPVIGGVPRHVQSLAREMDKRGHEVTVCTLRHGDSPSLDHDGRVKVHRLEGLFQRLPLIYNDPGIRFHPPVPDPLLVRRLRAIVAQEAPDIIHTHGWILHSVLCLRGAFDIPLVTTLHGYELFCPTMLLMKRDGVCDRAVGHACVPCGKDRYGLAKSVAAYLGVRMGRRRLRAVSRYIAVSSYVKETNCRALGLRDEDIVTVPCFYSPEPVEEEAVELPQDFVLFVGLLWPHKGVDVLLEAYGRLDTGTELVMIGGRHPDYDYRGTEGARVIADAPHGVVMYAMSRCRFAVFPSVWPEPFGTVAIEAMSQGKAVVASGIGGLRDVVVSGETGLLVNPNDHGALAEAVASLLARRELTAEMGRKGRERFAENFEADAVIPRIEEVYRSAI